MIVFAQIALLLPSTMLSQVTIGSREKPREGAILDLKQNNLANTNSTKGLLLPRVNLRDKHNLYPMFDQEYDKNVEDLKHAGLIVYNINACYDKGRGPYTWTSVEWSSIFLQNAQVYSYKDQNDNVFLAREFGEAGIWMVQNLAATTYDTKREGSYDNTIKNTAPTIKYPNNDETLTKTYPWMGVFYDFQTATNSRQGTTSYDVNNRLIQGMCPHGWHMPSSDEWGQLEDELIRNTSKYTSMRENLIDNGVDLQTNIPNTGTGVGYGANFRASALSPCAILDISGVIDGVSLNAEQGGFAIRMVGAVDGGDAVDGYGLKAGFWVANSDGSNGRNRVYVNSQDFINNNPGTSSRKYAVRCKKNDNIP